MPLHVIPIIISVILLTLAVSGCGGGGSSSGGSGGSGLSISVVAPSSIMVGPGSGQVETGITVFGKGLTPQCQILVDGQPVVETIFIDGTLEALVDIPFTATATHQISVQNGGTVSNTLPLTIYEVQQGPFVMQAIPGFLVGEGESNAPFILAADIDGDGLTDVIMPGPQYSNSIAILSGQADGTLAAPKYVPVPQIPYAMAVGDVDGNGTADLVSLTSDNSSSTMVSILFGDGHGNFQQPVTQQTFAGFFPGPAYLADLDGDGKPDLVLALEQWPGTNSSLVWLRNTGGGFAAPITLANVVTSSNFAVADFNGDGKADIVYTLYTPSSKSLHILMNQGKGNFADKAAVGLNGIVGAVTVLDFNLDGVPDLVVQAYQTGNSDALYSFSGNGDGSFTQIASLSNPGTIQLVTGDFDHDGFPDLAGPSGLEPSGILYFFGDGHGNFVLQPVVGPEGQYAAVGDFNGDGIPDVVVPDLFNFVSLALGRKDRNFPSPLALHPSTMTSISTGDIDGDGLPEIFVGGDLGDNIPGTVFLNEGNGSFQFAATTDPTSFELADLTGKGVVDLLGGNYNLEIWPNNGTLDFSSSPITFSQQTANVTVADMDGDGYADIVSACESALCTGLMFYGNGSYQFTPVTVPHLDFPYVIGDFNGDGKLDIADGATFLNLGGRAFQEVANNGLPLLHGSLAVVADFDGDGKDDVAINLPGSEEISIYYSRGDGTFYQWAQIDPGQYPGALAVGDFNGDGRPDLAVGLLLSQQVCLLFNNGNGEFTRSFFASGADVVALAAADLNRDGKPDLVIGNFVLDFAPPNVNVVFHK